MSVIMGNPFASLLDIILAVMIVLIGAATATMYLHLMPLPTGASNTLYAPLTEIYGATFTFFDTSFLFLFIFVVLGVNILISWFYPSVSKAIANIILLLGLAYFSLFVNITTITFNNALGFNSLLPLTYQFFNSAYYLIVTFFSMILCIIFNFRRAYNVQSATSYGVPS